MRSRDYDEDQWRHYQDRLAERGLLDGDGALTDAGRELKQHIEDTTDALALSALEALDDAEVEELFRRAHPDRQDGRRRRGRPRRHPDGPEPRRPRRRQRPPASPDYFAGSWPQFISE